jgi:hypothetical protein
MRPRRSGRCCTTILAADDESSVSHGYVRGDIPKPHLGRSG